jgi:hypothetical protein
MPDDELAATATASTGPVQGAPEPAVATSPPAVDATPTGTEEIATGHPEPVTNPVVGGSTGWATGVLFDGSHPDSKAAPVEFDDNGDGTATVVGARFEKTFAAGAKESHPSFIQVLHDGQIVMKHLLERMNRAHHAGQ